MAGAQVGTGGASKLAHSVSAPVSARRNGECWANGKSYNNIRKMLGYMLGYMLRIVEIYPMNGMKHKENHRNLLG